MRWILIAIRLNNNIKDMKNPPISLQIRDIDKSKIMKQMIPKMIVFHFFTLYLKREKLPIERRFSFHNIANDLIKAIMLIIKKVIVKAINISNFNPCLFINGLNITYLNKKINTKGELC